MTHERDTPTQRAREAPTTAQRELRWVQLRRPGHTAEIGQHGRVLAGHYHAGYDSWEVLLETYEGELSD